MKTSDDKWELNNTHHAVSEASRVRTEGPPPGHTLLPQSRQSNIRGSSESPENQDMDMVANFSILQY